LETSTRQRIYLAFNIGDSMFDDDKDVLILRRNISHDEFYKYLESGNVISCLNGSHQNTIKEIERRFDVKLPVPKEPPRIKLTQGDAVITISSRGLPRKTQNALEHQSEALERASFHFSLYIILDNGTR